jgi:hypothetical protein
VSLIGKRFQRKDGKDAKGAKAFETAAAIVVRIDFAFFASSRPLR